MACCKLRNTRHCLLVCKLPTFGRGNADSESPRDSGTDTAGAWMSRPCAGRCVPGLTHCAPDVGRLYVDLQTEQVHVSLASVMRWQGTAPISRMHTVQTQLSTMQASTLARHVLCCLER